MSFLAELRRRKVLRVGGTYAIVAWLLIQVAATVFPTLQLPPWTTTLATVLIILGFPIALVLAWAFQLTPDGVAPEQTPAGARPSGGKGVDYAILAGLVLIAAVTLLTQIRKEAPEPPAAVVSARPSVAVMPFQDMSPAGDQEYFGDGLADELLNELVRLDGIDVASRTSSFALKGSTESIQTIGRQLGVNTVLEGSIRKSGDKLRVTAQLINVADGYHVWSQTYDRDLRDVFAIQEEIARAVAGLLGVQFGVARSNSFRGAGTHNVEAYEEYLRSLSVRNLPERIRLLEHVVELDPDYAEGWAQLGLANLTQANVNVPSLASEYIESALPYIERAVDLDPTNAIAHSYLGTLKYAGNHWIEGQAEHDRAIALRARFDTLNQDANLLVRAGRSYAALAQWDAADAADPPPAGTPEFVSTRSFRLRALIALGRFDEAEAMLAQIPELQRRDQALLLRLNDGTADEVRAAAAAISDPPIAVTTLYKPLLDVFDDREAVLSLLRNVNASQAAWPGKWHDIARLAAYFGDPEFALEVAAEEARDFASRDFLLWMPVMRDVRKLPEFKQLVTDIGLVDYWRKYGWGEYCRPTGETDFSCS